MNFDYKSDFLKQAHKGCSRHKQEITESSLCGCFYCLETFSPKEIMDWIEQDEKLMKVLSSYNIPLEKFRWRSIVKGNKLIIKGKTTVLCVLKPLIKPYGDLQHVEPDTNNLRLYAIK